MASAARVRVQSQFAEPVRSRSTGNSFKELAGVTWPSVRQIGSLWLLLLVLAA
jgi:hypothetical protein